MNPDAHPILRSMTTAGILRQSFELYRENFLKLIGTVAPMSLIWVVLLQFAFENRTQTFQVPTGFGLNTFKTFLPAIMIFLSLVTTSAGTVIIVEGFLNRELTIGQAYQRLLNFLFPLLGALVISSTLITAGIFLFWIPGVVAYVWFCLIPPVVMVEGEGGVGSLKRSRAIVKGHFNKVFLTVPLLGVVQMLLIAIALLIPELPGNLFILYSISTFFSILFPLLIEPLKIVTTTLLYIDLRVRKEGYELQLLTEELVLMRDA